jgi:hypothetical protein
VKEYGSFFRVSIEGRIPKLGDERENTFGPMEIIL